MRPTCVTLPICPSVVTPVVCASAWASRRPCLTIPNSSSSMNPPPGSILKSLSTHIISDMEATATSIVLIQEGRLVAHLTPDKLVEKVHGKVWNVVTADGEPPAASRVVSAARRTDGIHLRLIADTRPNVDAVPLEATLEDAYVAMQT